MSFNRELSCAIASGYREELRIKVQGYLELMDQTLRLSDENDRIPFYSKINNMSKLELLCVLEAADHEGKEYLFSIRILLDRVFHYFKKG